MSKLEKIVKNIKTKKSHFKNVGYTMWPGATKEEEEDYGRQMDESYSFADKQLAGFHKEGTRLMKELFETMERAEESDPEDSVFVMRAAEFMMVDWLNQINPGIVYGRID